MGPCPFRHGYTSTFGLYAVMSFMLQWGHALSGMDTPGLVLVSSGGCRYASMGPCPFRHGYWLNAEIEDVQIDASMGPCPFRHGYIANGLEIITTNNRFNGAMPFQAWIPFCESLIAISFVLLQWGHALSGMDTDPAGIIRRESIIASMGPCPFRHGYQEIL